MENMGCLLFSLFIVGCLAVFFFFLIRSTVRHNQAAKKAKEERLANPPSPQRPPQPSPKPSPRPRPQPVDSQPVEPAAPSAEPSLQPAQPIIEPATPDMVVIEQEMASKIAELEEQLAQAQQAPTRAKSMAQITREGYVYVVSNVGSFGDGIYKVGMTRRLVPEDRIKELNSASVPFDFDVHAMIYAQDAPTLENTLHKALAPYRVNRKNKRKEFFRVSLESIEALVKLHAPEAEFTAESTADEYRASLEWLLEEHQEELDSAEDAELDDDELDVQALH